MFNENNKRNFNSAVGVCHPLLSGSQEPKACVFHQPDSRIELLTQKQNE
jgi:hypothetical protein